MTKAMKKIEETMLHGDLRMFIPRYTYRAFAITMTGIAAVFLLFTQIMQNQKTVSNTVYVPPTILGPGYIPLHPQAPVDAGVKQTPKTAEPITGTKTVSGNFVTGKDGEVHKIIDIATFENSGKVLSTMNPNGPATINDNRQSLANSTGSNTLAAMIDKQVKKAEVFEEWQVDQSPDLDYSYLKRNIEYPALARKIGVEGKVLINAVVSETGEILSVSIERSDNSLLDQAALDAVSKFGRFTPAKKQGKPVRCVVTIPIEFKLH